MPLTQTGRLFTVTSPLGADVFQMTGLAGREELSRPFRFTVELVSENTAVAAADLVGQPLGWAVNDPEDAPRYFHGVVRSLAAGPFMGRNVRTYRAEVVPLFWFLNLAADCKIYQAKTVPDIVKAVLGDFGVAFTDKLQGTYPAHEYRVQYRESAFAFVSRLMEEEGIFYYFTFADGAHTMVLADAPSAFAACAPHAEPEYIPERPNAEAIHGWERRYEYVSGKATHTDYNFETPATSLLANTPTVLALADMSKYEVFDYPGRYPVAADGTSLSKVRMQQMEVGYDTVGGAGRCSSFAAGAKFTPQNHPTDADEFVLLAVDHTGTDPWSTTGTTATADYRNTFECMPAATPFRPARATPRPVVPGCQPAVVVGPSGEEIYTDKYGRIKVQFYWDRLGANDEKSSCWMRVAEVWAGKNWGMVFTPRIGQEVLVDFLEGDPDQPVVTGRVYNALQMPPYDLPANMTQSGVKSRSSKGGGAADFNELRFEDKKGSEDIYFHAQKDFHRFVENDDDLKVEHDQTITIKNHRTEEVTEGNETITIKKGNRTEEVTEGNETITIKTGNRLVSVDTGNDTHLVKTGNRAVTVSKGNDTQTVETGDLTLTVKTGNRVTTVETGNDTHAVKTGNREVSVDTGNDTHTVKTGNRAVSVEAGNDSLAVKTGTITIKADAGKITIEAPAGGILLKCGSNTIEIAPSGITIKGLTVAIEGSSTLDAKSPMTTVKGDGMLTLKGGVTMIN